MAPKFTSPIFILMIISIIIIGIILGLYYNTNVFGNNTLTDCTVSEWGSCVIGKDGKYYKTRSVINQAQHGGKACPILSDTCAPIDCVAGAYGSCILNPVDNKYYQTRPIITEAQNGGKECTDLTISCPPIDCVASPLSDCTINSNGTWSKKGKIMVQAQNGGKPCNSNDLEMNCPPVDCVDNGYSDPYLNPNDNKYYQNLKFTPPKYGGNGCNKPEIISSGNTDYKCLLPNPTLIGGTSKYAPFGRDQSGATSCLSANGTDCLWYTAKTDCNTALTKYKTTGKSISCNQNQLNDPNSWCNKIATGRFTV